MLLGLQKLRHFLSITFSERLCFWVGKAHYKILFPQILVNITLPISSLGLQISSGSDRGEKQTSQLCLASFMLSSFGQWKILDCMVASVLQIDGS